jgi:hypothetical protein
MFFYDQNQYLVLKDNKLAPLKPGGKAEESTCQEQINVAIGEAERYIIEWASHEEGGRMEVDGDLRDHPLPTVTIASLGTGNASGSRAAKKEKPTQVQEEQHLPATFNPSSSTKDATQMAQTQVNPWEDVAPESIVSPTSGYSAALAKAAKRVPLKKLGKISRASLNARQGKYAEKVINKGGARSMDASLEAGEAGGRRSRRGHVLPKRLCVENGEESPGLPREQRASKRFKVIEDTTDICGSISVRTFRGADLSSDRGAEPNLRGSGTAHVGGLPKDTRTETQEHTVAQYSGPGGFSIPAICRSHAESTDNFVMLSALASRGLPNVATMSQSRLANALAAFLVEFDSDRTAEWIRLKSALERVFAREAITGRLLFGRDRLTSPVFQAIAMQGLTELDGVCRIGYKILIGRFCRDCGIEKPFDDDDIIQAPA